jgi:microcystin-dependent protein
VTNALTVGSSIRLSHQGNAKLDTTDTGITVTGEVGCNSVSATDKVTTKEVEIAGTTSGKITLKAQAAVTDYNLVFPAAQGSASNNSVLENDGAGNIIFRLTASIQPVGAIIAFGGTTAPTGWLMCDGTGYDKVTYNILYSVIGNAFGHVGTFFNVPDCRGLFLRGVTGSRTGLTTDADSRQAWYAGSNSGNNVGSNQMDEFTSHQHQYQDYFPDAKVEVDKPDTFSSTAFPYDNRNNSVRNTTSNPGGSETRPKNINVHYIIRSGLNS